MINQEELLAEIKHYTKSIHVLDKKATTLFQQAIIDTITNTITVRDTGEIFVATGDIPAMWLRDSTFQVLPYLELADKIPSIQLFIHGVLKQQLAYLRHDPYANAFNKEANDKHYSEDISNTPISPLVWERKFEIDSLCAPFFLAYHLFKKTGYTAHLNPSFWQAVEVAVATFIQEQHHEQSAYRFQRSNCPLSDTLSFGGKGTPVAYTGMVWSGFRPSDDACVYGYSIPGNCYIVVVLTQLLELLNEGQQRLKAKLLKLRAEIIQGIQDFGILTDEKGQQYYSYEVDGYGHHLFMDDANVPSLLSLPFLGYCAPTDPLYLHTRKKILSHQNPYYYSGTYLQGIGSPHTPDHYVWPIALAMEGLTTTDLSLIEAKIRTIATTDADTNQCHEGIDVNDPKHYTRAWFSWSNMTYCQLVFHYLKCSGKM